ncbi:MAG: hypothetical protein ACRDLL_14125 [Solirubrobacterales bacterium]
MNPDLLTAFAESIWVKSKALRAKGLTDLETRRLHESISEDIKKWTDLLPPSVSVAAKAEADRRGVDLRQMDWHHQHRFDRGRLMFQWEHVVPVRSIRKDCLAASSLTAVANVLETARVAWILKEEDRRLTDLGYRWERPDPDDAYRQARITLL